MSDRAVPLPDRVTVAKLIYSARPYRAAASGGVMDGFLCVTREFSWDGAPDFYQRECLEIADVVIAGLLLGQAETLEVAR